MKVLLFPDAHAACVAAAKTVTDQLRAKPASVLGLATGGTMEQVYDQLANHYAAGEVSLAQATSFNLDEYVGLSPDHPQSYRQTMQRLLFDRIDLPEAQSHLPRGKAGDLQAEAARYEAAISAAGGLDLQLLGIGHNGHIGFNEPTSSLGARTRIKTLTRQTRQANARYFGSLEDVPRYAITMGIATILDARHCVLVGLGEGKADAVARMIEGPLGADCPATSLQIHPRATIMLDPEAASALKLCDYYQDIHPDGLETDV